MMMTMLMMLLLLAAIVAEKKEQQFRHSIEGFDKMQLKSHDGAGDASKERSECNLTLDS